MKLSNRELKEIAKKVRIDSLKMINKAGSGHPLGSLSSADIYVALYFKALNHDPKNPFWEERDRLFVSHGHTCPAQYAVMCEAGYFKKENLNTYAKLGSSLQGHPERTKLPGIEITSGSLGYGLGQAAGYALSAKLDKREFRVFCITSDGEHDEGSHWEAVLFAAKYKLNNLTQIIDRNNIQIGGKTEEILPLKPLKEKYKAFDWDVIEINGHDFEEILNAIEKAKQNKKPTAIIAKTTGGKGVSFMENKAVWHAKHPNEEELKKALKELEK